MPWLRSLRSVCAAVALTLTTCESAPMKAADGVFVAITSEAQDARTEPGNATSTEGQAPQLIPRTHEEREQRYQTQHRIVLNVRVSDPSGRPWAGLNESDFHLLDNQEPRKITSFRSVEGGAPNAMAHVIMVLDTVNTDTRKLVYFRNEIEKYLKHQPPQMPYSTSIAIFSNAGIDEGQSSRNRDELLAGLKARTENLRSTGCKDREGPSEAPQSPWLSGGGPPDSQPTAALTCENERFVSSVRTVFKTAQREWNEPGRVILIWFGQGWPLLLNREFRQDTQQVKRNFFTQLVTLSTALREAQVTLDAVASPVDVSPDGGWRKTQDDSLYEGVPNESEATAPSISLHAFAHQSGGQIMYKETDVAGQIAACIADAEMYYVVAFDVPPASEFGEFHSLVVKVDNPQLKVRTNTIYYAEQ